MGAHVEDEAGIGPFSVFASNTHTRVGGSYRFGGKLAAADRHEEEGDIALARRDCAGRDHWRRGTVAAGAVVTKDVPDRAVVGGVPAKPLRSDPASAKPGDRARARRVGGSGRVPAYPGHWRALTPDRRRMVDGVESRGGSALASTCQEAGPN